MRILGTNSNTKVINTWLDWLKIAENHSEKNVIYVKDKNDRDYLIYNSRVEKEEDGCQVHWDSLDLFYHKSINTDYSMGISEFTQSTPFLDEGEEWAIAFTGKEINKENIEEYWEEILKKVKRYESTRSRQ